MSTATARTARSTVHTRLAARSAPPVTGVLARIRRRLRERPQPLLPVGPEPAGPWAGRPWPDESRVRADLRWARPAGPDDLDP